MDYGRNRDSLADIEERLTEVFEAIPSVIKNESGVPVVTAGELPAVLAEYSSRYGNLLSQSGESKLQEMVSTLSGVQITPEITLQLVAGLTTTNPPSSDSPPPPPKEDHKDPRSDSSGSSSPNPDTELRGRGEGTPHRSQTLSRTSSKDSVNRAPGAPATPLASGRFTPASPFDSALRQRSTPLSAAAPSAWTRKPLPASRRRQSDAGSANGNRSSSDNESSPAIARNSRRAPSNPVSPRMNVSNTSLPFPNSASAPFPSPDHALLSAARRSHSFDQSTGMSQTLVEPEFLSSKFRKTPALKFHSTGSDSDTDLESHSDDEESTHRYVRPVLSSDASLEPQDRIAALEKNYEDLRRKSADNERQMQNRLAERETEIADLETQLDDLKAELTASRREEKELRGKERTNMTQFATMESEIQKLQKSLDHTRTQYSSMQKQYQEQCAETERIRNVLKRKEQQIKEADDQAYMHEGEVQKWARERDALEHSIESLEVELNTTRQAINELDEQKQENLLLKETIDRMRFDLDALRAGMGPAASQEAQGTLSRSLANEIREGFERRERERAEAEEDETDAVVVEQEDGEGSEDGYIETTITTSRKRKVGTRPKPIVRMEDGMMREYADASAQHDESQFLTTSGVQHQQSDFVSESSVQHQQSDFLATAETQTEARTVRDMEIGTDAPSLCDAEIETESPHMQDAEIETETREVKDVKSGTESPEVREMQTETWEGVERAVGPDAVQSVEMGVETETPKTVHADIGTETKAGPERKMHEMEVQTDPAPAPLSHVSVVAERVPALGPVDLPPPYPQAAESGILKRWHSRRSQHAPGSAQAREDWAALKRLVGVECQVIERVIEGQDVDDLVEDKEPEEAEPAAPRTRKLFRISFEFTWWPCLLTHAVMGFGVWSLAAAVVVSQLVPQTPTYADRMNWSAYNNYAGALGEGLVGRSGDSAIWSAVERLVLGAAVRVGPGLPT